MAAVLERSPLLDPTKAAKVPITLSERFSRTSGRSERRNVNVQYNYKPESEHSLEARIRSPGSSRSSKSSVDTKVDLSLKNQDGSEYSYCGSQQSSRSCALIYNPVTQSLLLDKIDAEFAFNLQATPSNTDSKELTSQYPQLDTGLSDAESDDVAAVETQALNIAAATEADQNNPYDYRHFLKRRRTSSPPARAPQACISPAVPPRRNTKSKPRPRPQHRSPPPPPPREEADADNEDSDDGDLTIEMFDSPEPRRFGNGAVVFNHDLRNGPISLRSAASSMSPASIRHDSGNETEASDGDVEHLRLPSPSRKIVEQEQQDRQAEEDEDDDGLVGDLLQELENQDEEDEVENRPQAEQLAVKRTIEESSSESEEE